MIRGSESGSSSSSSSSTSPLEDMLQAAALRASLEEAEAAHGALAALQYGTEASHSQTLSQVTGDFGHMLMDAAQAHGPPQPIQLPT